MLVCWPLLLASMKTSCCNVQSAAQAKHDQDGLPVCYVWIVSHVAGRGAGTGCWWRSAPTGCCLGHDSGQTQQGLQLQEERMPEKVSMAAACTASKQLLFLIDTMNCYQPQVLRVLSSRCFLLRSVQVHRLQEL
jgi:hypothetical protein